MKPIDAAIASWITHCIKIISYSSYLVNTTNTYANLSPSKSNFLNELIATRMFYPATKRIKDNSKLMNPWLSVNLIKCSSWIVISPTGVSLAKQVKKYLAKKQSLYNTYDTSLEFDTLPTIHTALYLVYLFSQQQRCLLDHFHWFISWLLQSVGIYLGLIQYIFFHLVFKYFFRKSVCKVF